MPNISIISRRTYPKKRKSKNIIKNFIKKWVLIFCSVTLKKIYPSIKYENDMQITQLTPRFWNIEDSLKNKEIIKNIKYKHENQTGV